jgi:hypothetical protein
MSIVPDNMPRAEAVARWFHETYETLAPKYSYKTRKQSAVPWDEVPEKNRALMVATCHVLLYKLHKEHQKLCEEVARHFGLSEVPTAEELISLMHAERIYRQSMMEG